MLDIEEKKSKSLLLYVVLNAYTFLKRKKIYHLSSEPVLLRCCFSSQLSGSEREYNTPFIMKEEEDQEKGRFLRSRTQAAPLLQFQCRQRHPSLPRLPSPCI